MNALRLIYDTPPATIALPEEFRHGSIEVIIMPLSSPSSPPKASASWLSRFAGSWQGPALVREPQGHYESRDELK
jgi:hypothetical protein